jgi:hypothetical protein
LRESRQGCLSVQVLQEFAVVLEEQALRTWFGDAEVQAGQPGRLLEAMSIPTVSLAIMGPAGSNHDDALTDAAGSCPAPACAEQSSHPVYV